MFAGKKSAQIREILISESAWEEMTCLFAPSLEDGYLVFSDVSFFNITPNGSIPDDYIISIITDNVNVEYFESTIVAVGQIPNTNSGDIDNIGECQIFIRYKHSWIENKFKEKIIE
ncbi:TPA: hypothetical protein KFU06_003648 [Escherichia coli]|nr:hypothetical protein [Escherichia coli]